MRKRTLYLFRAAGSSDGIITVKKPKKVKTAAKSCWCDSPDCNLEPVAAGIVFERQSNNPSFFSFCTSGLEDAGITLKSDTLLKVTVEAAR